ncbi:addiction module antidote protein, HigA family [Pseudoroseomonas deserti]|uniref:Addiction module antidote protein, HigA family n=2 Tax=Teichococcus deserti TaxID=1817963 RepID=A0A1V2H7T4_9PROT|nr:HigA family addiction module antitoxin [Pseudoroseomonas deserti]ONG58811.1 addiction module antidote protein, HigA family [Pseudoroseomonas deserti]
MARHSSAPDVPTCPDHPGVLLREQILPFLGLSVSQVASELVTSRQNLHRILAGHSAISPAMAVRLERFCGVPAAFWLDRQQAYDLAKAQQALSDSLSRIAHYSLPDAVLIQIGTTHGR